MDRDRRALYFALVVGVAATFRVVWIVLHHTAPAQGFEAADLQRAMHYHWGLWEHLGWTWTEQIARDGFKPPLWYGGVPLLGAAAPTLGVGTFAVVHGGLTALTLAIGYRLGASSGPWGGALLVSVLVAMPGFAGRMPVLGVEAAHVALLFAWVLALRGTRAGWASVLGAGLASAAGLLAKWNFGAYAAVPWAWEFISATRARDAHRAVRLLVAAVIGLLPFAAWWVLAADSGAIAVGAGDEPTFVGDPAGAAAYLFLQFVRGVGPFVLLVALAGLFVGRATGPDSDRGLLWVTIVGLVLLHFVVPHKEARYLAPAFPLVAALVASVWARTSWAPLVAVLATGAAVSLALEKPDQRPLDELRVAVDLDDRGIGVVTEHPSFATRSRNVVTYALDAPVDVLNLFGWRFYASHPVPVLSRGNHPDLRKRSAAFDLERSTHVLVGRDLSDDEVAILSSMGFVPGVGPTTPDLVGLPPVTLYVLESGADPPMRGPGPPPPPH